jgi:type II secretory pathway pseudopilin PulG
LRRTTVSALKKQAGFTLIEVVIFIVVTSILATTIMLAFTNALQKAPTFLNNMIATQTAKKCMDWYVGQRWLNGYSSISCPSTSVPSFCTAPSGYTLAVNVSCTTINSDANYKTITVTLSGEGDASLTTLVANY